MGVERRVTRAMTKSLPSQEQRESVIAAAAPTSTTRLRLIPKKDSSSDKTTSSSTSQQNRGLIRCVCNGFLRSLHDQLIECTQCRNWCHAGCVGITNTEVAKERATFVCPFCTGDSKKRKRAVPDPSPRQVAKLHEVPDDLPHNPLPFQRYAEELRKIAKDMNVTILDLPNKDIFTDVIIEECMECCSSAIEDATFSESYPRYCLKELQGEAHQYLQGCLLRHNASGKIVAFVISNGMDPYGNIKQTVTGIKKMEKDMVMDGRDPHGTFGLSYTGEPVNPAFGARRLGMLKDLIVNTDFSDMVHFTLIATHPEFRGHSYAKMLMVNDMIRWRLRGRTRAFLNMALEKRLSDAGKVMCNVQHASQRLYEVFGFLEVAPKYNEDGSFRWTPKEADMGRVMANCTVEATIDEVMAYLHAKHRKMVGSSNGGAHRSPGKKGSHSSTTLKLKK